jgi:heme-degrading monooxygenase HmoA
MFRRLALAAAAAIFAVAGGRASDAGLNPQKSASASPSVKPKPMIARIWHGRTLTAKADEYQKYLNASGVAKILKTDGNHGVEVLRKADGPRTDFIVISYWESIDAVRRFAGADYEKAVVLERDREFLIEVEPNVLHYEVVRTAGEKTPER